MLDAIRQRRGIDAAEDGQTVIAAHVERVEIRSAAIVVTLRPRQDQYDSQDGPNREDDGRHTEGSDTITIPWRKTPSRQPREIIVPQGSDDHRPARVETNRKLVAAIACGRRWLHEILSGTATVEAIAARERCSIRRVDMTVQMAFLSPALVKAAVEGRLPRGIGVSRLFGLPPQWDRQLQALGLPAV